MHTLKNLHAAALVALVLAAAPVQAGEAILAGRADTIDGDTIEIRRVTIRLKSIAAPERNEPGRKEATEAKHLSKANCTRDPCAAADHHAEPISRTPLFMRGRHASASANPAGQDVR